jgi:hypothetical protein
VCFAVVDEGYLCGTWPVSLCKDGLSCIGTGSTMRYGYCLRLCDPPDDEDAGYMSSMCPPDIDCQPELITPEGKTGGFCGNRLDHLDTCNEDPLGILLCPADDVCAPEIAWDGRWICRQACTFANPTCKSGTCRAYGKSDSQTFYACY